MTALWGRINGADAAVERLASRGRPQVATVAISARVRDNMPVSSHECLRRARQHPNVMPIAVCRLFHTLYTYAVTQDVSVPIAFPVGQKRPTPTAHSCLLSFPFTFPPSFPALPPVLPRGCPPSSTNSQFPSQRAAIVLKQFINVIECLKSYPAVLVVRAASNCASSTGPRTLIDSSTSNTIK